MAVTGALYRSERCCFGARYLQVIFVLLASSAVTTVLQVTAESKTWQAPDRDDPSDKFRSVGPLGAAPDYDVTKSDVRDPVPRRSFPWVSMVTRQMLRRMRETAARKHSMRKDILQSVGRPRQHQKQILGNLCNVRLQPAPWAEVGIAGEASAGTETNRRRLTRYILGKIKSWSIGGSADSREGGAANAELGKKKREHIMKQLRSWSRHFGMPSWLGIGLNMKGKDHNPGKPPHFETGMDSSGVVDDILYPFLDKKQAVNFFSPEVRVSKCKQWLQKLLRMVKEHNDRADGEGEDPLDQHLDSIDSLDDDDADELDARFTRQSSANHGSFDSSEEEVDKPTEDPLGSEDWQSSESDEGSDSDEDIVSDVVDEYDKRKQFFDSVDIRFGKKPEPAFPHLQHLHGRRARRMQYWARRRFQAIKKGRNRLQMAMKRRLKAARRRITVNRRTLPEASHTQRRMSHHKKIFPYTSFGASSPNITSTDRRPFGRRPHNRRRRLRARRKLRRQWRKKSRRPFQAGRMELPRNLDPTGNETATHSGRTSSKERTTTTNDRNSEQETTTSKSPPRSSAGSVTEASTPAGRTTAGSAKKPASSSQAAGNHKSTAIPYVDLTPVRETHLGRVEDRTPQNYTLDSWEGRSTGGSGSSGGVGGRNRPDMQWPGGLYIRVPYNQQDDPRSIDPRGRYPGDTDNADDDRGDDRLRQKRGMGALRLPRRRQRRSANRNTAPRVFGINGYNGDYQYDSDADDSNNRNTRYRPMSRRDSTPQNSVNNGDEHDNENDEGNGRNSRAGGLGFVQIAGKRGNRNSRGGGGVGGQRRIRPSSRYGNRRRGNSQAAYARQNQPILSRNLMRREERFRRRQRLRWLRQQRQRQETNTSNVRPDRDDDDDDASDGNVSQGGSRVPPRRPQIQHISIHNDDRNGDSEAHFRSPFINHRTAYDFLSTQAGRRPGPRSRPYVVSGSRSRNNEQQSEQWQFSHTMSESLCEVFDKHFVPSNAGGRCV